MAIGPHTQYDQHDLLIKPADHAFSTLWYCICPTCGAKHGKQWDVETNLCEKCRKKVRKHMHYRNGREAKNGDNVVQLNGGVPVAAGKLQNATAGNDYCNGQLVVTGSTSDFGPAIVVGACLCDCLHADDFAAILAEKGLDKRPEGK